MSKKEIHSGHRSRVKKRYINDGLENFEDHQVLELLLFYCYPRIDTNEKAHEMIKEFGSLSNLFEAHPYEIMKKCNVTENVAVFLSMIPHVSKRYKESKLEEKVLLNSSKKVGEYALSLFLNKKYECFYLICLDNSKRLIKSHLVSKGTIDEAPIYPRIILEECLKYSAANVILAHNHPGGTLSASKSDIEVTRIIRDALKIINIKVLDHIIVADNEYFSFTEKNLINF